MASDMQTCCFFDFILKCLEVLEHFALLSHWVDPSVLVEIVNEHHVISAFAECNHLSRPPYVGVDYVQCSFTHIPLLGKWMTVLLAEWASILASC